MGGIPWQSAGCASCRKRKVKCDLQTPECLRCIKRGNTCPGYMNRRFLAHFTPSKSTESSLIPAQTFQHRAQPMFSSIPQAIDFGLQNRLQIYSCFLEQYQPLDETPISQVDRMSDMIVDLPMVSRTEMLDRALSAVACLTLGLINGDNTMYRHGIELYNVSLRLLSSSINRKAVSDDMIFTTAVFQVIEGARYNGDPQPYWQHNEATSMLLGRYCGAKLPTPLFKYVFTRTMEFGCIFAAALGRRICVDPRSLSWFQSGPPIDQAYGHFFESLFLQEAQERLDMSDSRACAVLLLGYLDCKRKILAWYSGIKKTFDICPELCASEKIPCGTLPAIDGIFGKPYKFTSLTSAKVHVLYLVSMLQIQGLIYFARALALIHEGVQFSKDPMCHDEFQLARYYSMEICRSAPYFLQDKKRICGAMLVIPPLVQASKAFAHSRSRKQFDWCLQSVCRLADLGAPIAMSLGPYCQKYWSLAEDPVKNFVLSLQCFHLVPRDENANGDSTKLAQLMALIRGDIKKSEI